VLCSLYTLKRVGECGGVDKIKVDKYSYMTSVRRWTDKMHALLIRIEVCNM
jgi:hypothetical protein